MTRAVILAAGRGSRLDSLTADRPKAMVEWSGRPLIAWQVDALRAAGIDEIAIVRGYLGHAITIRDTVFIENPDWADSNMVASLMRARDWLGQGGVAAYADLLYGPEPLRALEDAAADIAITYDRDWLDLWSRRFEDPLSDAETFALNPDGTLRDIGRKPSSIDEVQGQYMGLLRFSAEGFARVTGFLDSLPATEVAAMDMTTLLRRLIGQGVPVSAIPVRGGWGEVDTPDDLLLYEREPPFSSP